MKIRYINLGEIDGGLIMAEHEITKHIPLEFPTITVFCAKTPLFSMTCFYKVYKYLNPKEIT